jgi:hypothetical protein
MSVPGCSGVTRRMTRVRKAELVKGQSNGTAPEGALGVGLLNALLCLDLLRNRRMSATLRIV